MKHITYSFSLLFLCFAGNALAQRPLIDSTAMRKEWLKTIDRTTEDLSLSYNHQSMGDILIERADAEANLKRYSKAIDDYNKAIFFNPALKQVYVRRAHVYEVMRSYKAAIGEYEKMIATMPGDKPKAALLWTFIAGNQFALGNFEKAAKADSAAVALVPNFSMAYANKGWANLHLNKYAQAVDDFTQAMKGFQNAPPQQLAAIYRNRGDAYRMMEKHTEAIADYTSALQYYPDFADCYWGLATSYGMTGQYLLAENNFARSAKLLSGNDQQLSRLYVDWGGMEDVRRNYVKKLIDDSLAVVYDGKNADAIGALAHAYALNGRMQQSVDRFYELARFYPGNQVALTDIYGSIAEQEYFLGHYDKAIEASNAALAADPQAWILYVVRARAYQKKSNNDLATADFNKVLALDTGRQSSSYALALFFTGKQDQAIGIMQSDATTTSNKLIRLSRYYQLARVYALMNKPEEANLYLKKSIEGGYSGKYALADPDLNNIRDTPEFKNITGGK